MCSYLLIFLFQILFRIASCVLRFLERKSGGRFIPRIGMSLVQISGIVNILIFLKLHKPYDTLANPR